jgi:hypothetical protein
LHFIIEFVESTFGDNGRRLMVDFHDDFRRQHSLNLEQFSRCHFGSTLAMSGAFQNHHPELFGDGVLGKLIVSMLADGRDFGCHNRDHCLLLYV